jgi:hypothetical protein
MGWVLQFLEDFGFFIAVMLIVTIIGTLILTTITGNFWGSLALSGLAGVVMAESTIIIN